MLSARSSGIDVLASDVTKADGPFTCPACKDEVLLKKGRVKIHHFAHIPPCHCVYGTGESEAHRQAKRAIYEVLSKSPHVSKLKMERYLGDVRPDISFCFNNHYIAVEVQISSLPLDIVVKRTEAYAQKGIYLLWTSPMEDRLQESTGRYAPRVWEKYLHSMYFGKVYYWVGGFALQPVHFDKYELYVEERSWWEGEGRDAQERSEGGYFRRSKRYRTPRFLDIVNITELAPVTRKAWSSKEFSVPAARLWCLKKQ